MTNVWGYTDYLGDVSLVNVAIRRLRMKIEDDPSHPQFIMTRRGAGYYFETQRTCVYIFVDLFRSICYNMYNKFLQGGVEGWLNLKRKTWA